MTAVPKKKTGRTYAQNAKIVRLVKKLVTLQEEMKRLYEEMDETLDSLTEVMEVGEVVRVGEKVYTLKDNFAESNVCFKATAIRRYEVKEVKQK